MVLWAGIARARDSHWPLRLAVQAMVRLEQKTCAL